MAETIRGKALPTTEGQKRTKKYFILEYAKNRPASASEIANKVHTTPGYVYKVRSQARTPSKDVRGRNGRIFAHGKSYYEYSIMPDTASMLKAPVINHKTGLKQIGCIKDGNPCSCQIHSNGHIIAWPHYTNWKEWLVEKFTAFGWKPQIARFVVDNLKIHILMIEGGVKPLDSSFLPNELYCRADWGLVIVKDNTPEKGVLEMNLSVPDMQSYLGLPEISKRLQVIEQGSVTLNQSYRTIVALLISLEREWQKRNNATNSLEE